MMLLFVCENITDFFMMILYPATLQNSLTSSRSFSVDSESFLHEGDVEIISEMLSCRDNFIYFQLHSLCFYFLV
jgi:hypothetical protein